MTNGSGASEGRRVAACALLVGVVARAKDDPGREPVAGEEEGEAGRLVQFDVGPELADVGGVVVQEVTQEW